MALGSVTGTPADFATMRCESLVIATTSARICVISRILHFHSHPMHVSVRQSASSHAKPQLHHSYVIDQPAQQAYEICRGNFSWHSAPSLERKQFIRVVLRDVNWNKSKAARALGMHRSTLVRTLRELKIDILALHNAERRPPRGTGVQQQKKIAG